MHTHARTQSSPPLPPPYPPPCTPCTTTQERPQQLQSRKQEQRDDNKKTARMKISFIFLANFLLLALLVSTGSAQPMTRAAARALAQAAAAAAGAAGGGGGAAMPGPLVAGAAGGGAAMPGPVPAAAAGAGAGAGSAAGGGAAVPPGGVGVLPGGLGGDSGSWMAWAWGAIAGARTFVQAHRVAAGVTGATVAVAGGVASYKYGPQALDWFYEDQECYRVGKEDYKSIVELDHGGEVSLVLTQGLVWGLSLEGMMACRTGVRPHQQRLEQAADERREREAEKAREAEKKGLKKKEDEDDIVEELRREREEEERMEEQPQPQLPNEEANNGRDPHDHHDQQQQQSDEMFEANMDDLNNDDTDATHYHHHDDDEEEEEEKLGEDQKSKDNFSHGANDDKQQPRGEKAGSDPPPSTNHERCDQKQHRQYKQQTVCGKGWLTRMYCHLKEAMGMFPFWLWSTLPPCLLLNGRSLWKTEGFLMLSTLVVYLIILFVHFVWARNVSESFEETTVGPVREFLSVVLGSLCLQVAAAKFYEAFNPPIVLYRRQGDDYE